MSQDQDKTEKPTAKRLAELRKKGDIAYSKDATGTAALCGGVLAGISVMGGSAAAVTAFAQTTFARLTPDELGTAQAGVAHALIWGTLPIGLGAVAGALIIGGAQVWPPRFKVPVPNFARFLSGQSIGQMLSPKAIAGRTVVQIFKFGLVAVVALSTLSSEHARFQAEPALEGHQLLLRIFDAIRHLSVNAMLVLAGMAGFDFVKTKIAHLAKIKMSRQEIKREHKEQEGDSRMKGRRRRRMREISKRRVAAAVPKADVVIVNPTEYAVALRYQAGSDRAPRVLAKGRGPLAERIRELARQHGVPVISSPPLTRAVYKLCPEGREIPAALYKAVAEVLAYVYKLRARHSSSTMSPTSSGGRR